MKNLKFTKFTIAKLNNLGVIRGGSDDSIILDENHPTYSAYSKNCNTNTDDESITTGKTQTDNTPIGSSLPCLKDL